MTYNPSIHDGLLEDAGINQSADGSVRQPAYSFQSNSQTGFFYDPTTGNVLFAKNGVLTPLANVASAYQGRAAYGFGGSITAGTNGETGGVDTTNGYPYVVAREMGLTFTNFSEGGTGLDRQLAAWVMNQVVRDGDIYIADFGLNQGIGSIAPTGANATTYVNQMLAALVWCSLRDENKIKAINTSRVVKAGTWTQRTPALGAPVHFDVLYTESGGSPTLTIADVMGSTIYVGYSSFAASSSPTGATFTVSVDGVVKATVNTSVGRTALHDPVYTIRDEIVRIAGLTPGPHTVVITSTNSAAGVRTEISWVGGNGISISGGSQPEVYLSSGFYITPAALTAQGITKANLDAYQALRAQAFSQCEADGLPVHWTDWAVYYDPNLPVASGGAGADGIHPGASGHRRLADAVERAMAFTGVSVRPLLSRALTSIGAPEAPIVELNGGSGIFGSDAGSTFIGAGPNRNLGLRLFGASADIWRMNPQGNIVPTNDKAYFLGLPSIVGSAAFRPVLVSAGGFSGDSEALTTAATALYTTLVHLCNATSGAFTVTLSAANFIKGQLFFFKKTDAGANAVTINPAAGEQIDNLTAGTGFTLTAGAPTATLYSDGTKWYRLN